MPQNYDVIDKENDARLGHDYYVLWDCFCGVCTLADSGFFKNFLYQGGVKSAVSWVFEDLKFKISEDYDQNWCFPESAQLTVLV